MPLAFLGRALRQVGVVGCGETGASIALSLARALVRHGVPVLACDVSPAALDAARERSARELEKAVRAGALTLSEASAAGRNLAFTQDKSLLVGCDLVIEAGPDSLEARRAILDELERLVDPAAVLASSSTHLEPERLFARARRPERAVVLHHFPPAGSNPVIEVVAPPGSPAAEACARLYEALGRVPVRSRGRPGHATGPLREGISLAALLAAEEGVPPRVVEAIACRALGLASGPFAALNAPGEGRRRQAHLNEYHEAVMPWFRSPKSLDEKVAAGGAWETIDRGDTVSYSDKLYTSVSGRILGTCLGLAAEAVESRIVEPADLEIAVEMGLGMRPPLALMNELGPDRVRELAASVAALQPGFRVPAGLGPWRIPFVFREDRGDVAVLTIRRPAKLNALTRETFRQLEDHFAAIQSDPRIRAAALTGFGTRAFVSGADVAMLSALPSPEDAREVSRESNRVLRRIEQLGKPVVCALNGLSLGGGSELAYACTARIARRGIAPLFGQPEVKLGIIPGAGGTQRLPRLIDFAAAWKLLRTGGTLTGEEALRLGLILEETEGDPVPRAVELARALKPGEPPPPRVPASPPDVDLGGLSRRVDEILRKAVLQGAAMPLDEALEFESECFGEVFATRDRRIGLEHFLKNGLKRPAPFAHA